MKKIWYFLVGSIISFNAIAQEKTGGDEDKPRGFQKDKLFTGGTLNLSFGNRITQLGISPYFGYSLNKYLDVAVSVGFNYSSQRDNIVAGDKVRQTIIGPGAFVRVYPVHFLFAQAQIEHNFINLKYIPDANNTYMPQTEHLKSTSFLIGGGYTSGRRDGNTFYYLSVLWDVGNSIYSPYKDELNRAIPIFRAGYNIALFQGRRK